MIKRLAIAIPLLIAGALVVCLIVLMLTGRERVWTTFFGNADLGPAHFETLVPPATPNHYLVCPANLCMGTEPDRISEPFPLAADRLLALVGDSVAEMDSVQVVNVPAPDDFRFIHRSRFFRFPDTISVSAIEGEPGTSALAIYSRSQMGKSDFGVNENRVEALLGDVRKRVAAMK